MKQVFVAAWVGLTLGWLGFGAVLTSAPGERTHAPFYVQARHGV